MRRGRRWHFQYAVLHGAPALLQTQHARERSQLGLVVGRGGGRTRHAAVATVTANNNVIIDIMIITKKVDRFLFVYVQRADS